MPPWMDRENKQQIHGKLPWRPDSCCTQSNAAVDELLYGRDGMMFEPYLVRVSNEMIVHRNSLHFFIDTLADTLLAKG